MSSAPWISTTRHSQSKQIPPICRPDTVQYLVIANESPFAIRRSPFAPSFVALRLLRIVTPSRKRLAGDSPLGLSARHLSARAMGRALERLPVSEAADDERAGSHRSGNDPQLPRSRANCPFARHEHALSEMHFVGDVVVVAVDRHGQTELADVPLE